MTKTRITRATSFAAVLPLFAFQAVIPNAAVRFASFAITVSLLVYLWLTSRRDTHTLLTLTLNRIAIAGFALVGLWGLLNAIRSLTYDIRIEGPPSWKATVGNYAVLSQPPVFWSGVALAVIFTVVLLVGLIHGPATRHRKPRSL